MKKLISLMLLISAILLIQAIDVSADYESDMKYKVTMCNKALRYYDDSITKLKEEIVAKDYWVRTHIALTRAQGNSQTYIQNVRARGNEFIAAKEEEIAELSEKYETEKESCDAIKEEWTQYLSSKYVGSRVDIGENPCGEDYYPKDNKCLPIEELCLDHVNSFYDWRKEKCICNSGFEWRLRRCRPVDGYQSLIGNDNFASSNIVSLVYSKRFQEVGAFKVRFKQIKDTEKSLMQFYIADESLRESIYNYKVQILEDSFRRRNRFLTRGNMVFAYNLKKQYVIYIDAFDKDGDALVKIKFDLDFSDFEVN